MTNLMLKKKRQVLASLNCHTDMEPKFNYLGTTPGSDQDLLPILHSGITPSST